MRVSVPACEREEEIAKVRESRWGFLAHLGCSRARYRATRHRRLRLACPKSSNSVGNTASFRSLIIDCFWIAVNSSARGAYYSSVYYRDTQHSTALRKETAKIARWISRVDRRDSEKGERGSYDILPHTMSRRDLTERRTLGRCWFLS